MVTLRSRMYYDCDFESDRDLGFEIFYLIYTRDTNKWWKIIDGAFTEVPPANVSAPVSSGGSYDGNPATITQDITHRFASDSEKILWNAKQDALGFTAVNTLDARLSDARTPLTHSHAQSDVTNLVSDLAGKQPLDSDLTAIAAISPTNGDTIMRIAGAWLNQTMAQLKTALGLVKGDVGLGSVDNTSDASKPVSSAGQTALNLKANLASPTFTGTVVLPASTAFTTPVIGAATGTSLVVTGAITSSGAGIGYVAGAGGTITQATSRTTGVTLNKLCGNITMFSAAQANNALVTFTLTNSFITATDYLLIQHISATNGGAWTISTVCGAGSVTISIRNHTTASITEATPLRFTIIKGATS